MPVELTAIETDHLVTSAAVASGLLDTAIGMVPADRPLLLIILQSAHAHLMAAGDPVLAAVARAEQLADAQAAYHASHVRTIQ